jgi:8-oxo-dGTP diphosphatase
MKRKRIMTDYALGFAFNKELTHVALIKKIKPTWQAGLLNGIGGKIEEGEEPIDAMVREFREESGIESQWFQWRELLTMGSEDWTVYVYFTNVLDISKAESLTDEIVGIYDVNNILLNRMLSISNLPWIISLVLDKDYINGKIWPGHIGYDF